MLKVWMVVLGILASLLAKSVFADVVTLHDGRKVTGVVVREVNGAVWVETGHGEKRTEFHPATEVARIELDPESALRKPVAMPPARPGAVKAAVVSLGGDEGDYVGVFISPALIELVATRLKADLGEGGKGVVVLRLNSGGGNPLEGMAVAEAIARELKPSWRVVCWVEKGLGSALLSVYTVEELVFATQGELGMTLHSSLLPSQRDPTAVETATIDLLARGERLSAMGKRDPLLLRSMQLAGPLSATRTPESTRFFADAVSGEVLLSKDREPICFNAKLAERVGISEGTADTLEEVTKLLGYEELDWVGDRTLATRVAPWPVCDAERVNRARRAELYLAGTVLGDLHRSYKKQFDQAAKLERRVDAVSNASAELAKIRKVAEENPAVGAMVLGPGWREYLDSCERDLKRLGP